MTKRKFKKRIAPRLANGERRETASNGLPPDVKEALQAMAKAEGKSYSWMMEEVIIRYFHLPRPIYIKVKKGTK